MEKNLLDLLEDEEQDEFAPIFHCVKSTINYKSYIEKTQPLITNIKDDKLIKYIRHENNIIGRKFIKKNGIEGYDEIFLDLNQKLLLNLCDQISFLFPPSERNLKKIIGIRYYYNNVINFKEGYFTLVIKSENKFEILEKTKEIYDYNGSFFYLEDLDCLEIINQIIFKKIRENLYYIFPCSFVEIIGFIYAAKQKHLDNCMIVDPYIPNPFNSETLVESNLEIKENFIYLEPIIYNKHISLLLFIISDKKRKNFLIDFSNFHKNILKNDNYIFPIEMKTNLTIIPNYPIQFGETCGLWFLSLIYCVIENGILLFKGLRKRNSNFYIKIIKKNTEILNIKNFIWNNDDKEEEKEKDLIFEKYTISRKITYNGFLDVKYFLRQQNIYLRINFISKYEKYFEETRNIIFKLQINKNHYENVTNKRTNIIENNIKNIENLFDKSKNIFNELYEFDIKIFEEDKIELYDIYKQKEYQLNNIFNYIKSQIKDIEDNLYLYNIEDLTKIYLENGNDIMFSFLVK